MKTKKNKRGSRAGVVVLLVVLAVVLLSGGAFVFFGAQARASDTIYPNVSAFGVQLGGMTVEEAAAALAQSDYNEYDGKSVTVRFPAELEMTVTAEEAGLCGDERELAQSIYDYGRNGSFFGNAAAYIGCVLGGKELDAETVFQLDEAHIRERIDETAREVNSELLQNSLNIGEKEITIIKGSSGMVVDNDAVYQLIHDAFETKNFTTIEYTPEIDEPKELDLDSIYKVVHVEPKDSVFDEEFNASQERVGVSFDKEAAQRMLDAAEVGDTVTIPLIFTQPEHTKAELEALLFRDVLASKTTDLSWNDTRSKNVELAAAATNGVILMPGDVYDFNEAVGERTIEKGYGYATAYIGGESVLDVGGGICQVSSTIYYACLYADLEIVYRTCHMYASDYVPYGMDATVSWGGPEFKFRNDTDYPIKLETYRDGQTMTATIYGTKLDDTYIEMDYVITEWLTEYPTIYKEKEGVAPGTIEIDSNGYAGFIVETYKYKYNGDGTLISKTFEDESIYDPHPKIIFCAPGEKGNYVDENGNEIVPTPTPSPSPSPSPSPTPEPTPEPTPSPEGTPDPSSEPTDPSDPGAETTPPADPSPEVSDVPETTPFPENWVD